MPYTPAITVEIFQTPEGKQWRLAGTDDKGTRYFVPAHLDPAKIRPLVWAPETYLKAELGTLAALYCTGDRCADCTPDEECCEATCGCCLRVDEHDHCRLAPGSEEDSKYCDQHGEGSLNDRAPEAELRYQILRTA